MKHNLLRNFLALVLSGIMLAGVGCKNYDDDIDKINNRLDELYVTVADLDEQIESVRNAIPSLDALNEEVAALRSELDGVKTDVASIDQKLEAIGDVQAKLNELSQELKDYVNGAIQSSEETLRNELATKGAVSELEALIEGIQEDYKAELEEINNKLTALEGTVGELPAVDFSGDIQELKDRLTALEGSAADAEALADLTGRVEALEGIKVLTESDVNTLIESQISEMLDGEPWLGDSLNEAIAAYLTNNGYITNAALSGYVSLEDIIDEMEKEQSDYAAALIAFIQANQTQIDANELQILVDGNQKNERTHERVQRASVCAGESHPVAGLCSLVADRDLEPHPRNARALHYLRRRQPGIPRQPDARDDLPRIARFAGRQDREGRNRFDHHAQGFDEQHERPRLHGGERHRKRAERG